MAKRKVNELDKAIERAYYIMGQGKQINIMDIGKLFNDCRTAVSIGEPLNEAMGKAISKYCQGVN